MKPDDGQNGLHPLAKIRQDLGLTQTELATLSGLPRSAVAAVEHGSVLGVSAALRRALARLQVDTDDLQRAIAAWRESRRAALERELAAQRHPPVVRPWPRGDLRGGPPGEDGTP